MGRSNYTYLDQTDFRGGWCLEQENAAPNQLLTARNVWAPEGRLETRPGFVGISYLGDTEYVSDLSDMAAASETTAGGFTSETPGSISIDRTERASDYKLYFGFSSPNQGYIIGGSSSHNTQEIGLVIEALTTDGTWLPVNTAATSTDAGVPAGIEEHIPYFNYSLANPTFGFTVRNFMPPASWANIAIPGYSGSPTKYWIRYRFVEVGDSNLWNTSSADASFAVVSQGPTTDSSGNATRKVKALYAPQFSSGKRYVYGGQWVSNVETFAGADYFKGDWNFTNKRTSALSPPFDRESTKLVTVGENEPASYANAPLFDECYVAYDYTVTRHRFDGTNELATVEDRDFAVGGDPADEKTWASYYPDWVATFADFPKCKYITFFAGKLWAVNLKGADVQLQWSAPEPYHNVWPVTNVSNIMEDDNSPITGVSSLGENLVIFKNDSIWQMIYTGTAEHNEDIFVPRKVTSTVGCVSNSSIVRTPLGLIFLAEDGVYLYNGNPTPTKISDPIDEFFTRVYAPRRRFAAATHYKTKNCYLLSLSVDNSTANNLVLCYDYKHGAWYEWSGIPVEVWMPDEGPSDDERIYFGDSNSNLYQLFGQHDDGLAIESTVLTHRKGFGDFSTKSLRELRINGANDVNSWDVEILKNDNPEGYGTSGPLAFTDEVEAQWPVTAAGDYGHIIADGTALPTATGSISTAQHNMPGERLIVIGFAENKAYANNVLASGGVQIASFTLAGVDATGATITEIVTLTEDAKFGTSVNQYYKVTSLSLTTLTTVSSGTADAEYFVGYSAGPDKPKWMTQRRREKRLTCREDGEWFQIKLTANQFGRKMKLHRLSLGYITIGNR